MAFELERFIALRPFAFHLTDHANLPLLRKRHFLQSAAELIRESGENQWLRGRRPHSVSLPVNDGVVVLKDQRPLVLANVELVDGWTEEDYIAHLNEHVFFWPGTLAGPNAHGKRLIESYRREETAILRIPTVALLTNGGEALFCNYNSGAPRMSGGRRSPRGPDIFLPHSRYSGSAGDVKELVFRGRVELPEQTVVLKTDGTSQPLRTT